MATQQSHGLLYVSEDTGSHCVALWQRVCFVPLFCNQGADLLQARGQELGDGAESLGQVWERAQGCWQHVIQVSLRLL